jgi:hypothetical protein
VRDVTGDPLASRKAMLIEVIVRAQLGLRFNEHLEGHGPIVSSTRAAAFSKAQAWPCETQEAVMAYLGYHDGLQKLT